MVFGDYKLGHFGPAAVFVLSVGELAFVTRSYPELAVWKTAWKLVPAALLFPASQLAIVR